MPVAAAGVREELMKIVASLFACALSIAPAFANDLPKFQVDASWPKTLPNNWIMGQAAGVAVDAHRPRESGDPGRIPAFAGMNGVKPPPSERALQYLWLCRSPPASWRQLRLRAPGRYRRDFQRVCPMRPYPRRVWRNSFCCRSTAPAPARSVARHRRGRTLAWTDCRRRCC